MNENQLLLSTQEVRRLLTAASPDAALLWLYLKTGGPLTQAPAALSMSDTAVESAVAVLRQIGLIEERCRVLRSEERPVYTEQDILKEEASGTDFAAFRMRVESLLGKKLTTEDLKSLLCIRNYLGLPDEVTHILINYCISRNSARGNLRSPTLRAIEKEACRWADDGIDTETEAISFVMRQMRRQEKMGAIRRTLQIYDRHLVSDEEKYINAWLDMGFGEREIGLAYNRTCLQTGSMNWKYMNRILGSWKEKNLFTVEEIEAGDRAPERRSGAAGKDGGDEVDPYIKRALERRRQKKEEP